MKLISWKGISWKLNWITGKLFVFSNKIQLLFCSAQIGHLLLGQYFHYDFSFSTSLGVQSKDIMRNLLKTEDTLGIPWDIQLGYTPELDLIFRCLKRDLFDVYLNDGPLL